MKKSLLISSLLSVSISGFALIPPAANCWCTIELNNKGTLSPKIENEKRDVIVNDIGFEKLGSLLSSEYVDAYGYENIANTAEVIGGAPEGSDCAFRFQRKIVDENWFILSNSPTEGQSIIDLAKDVIEVAPEMKPPYMADLDQDLMDLTPSATNKIYNVFTAVTPTKGTLSLADVGDILVHRVKVEEWIEAKNANGKFVKSSRVLKYHSRKTFVANKDKQWVPMDGGEDFETMKLEGPPYLGPGQLVEDRSFGITLIKFPAQTKLESGEIVPVQPGQWSHYKIHNDIIELE